MSTRNLEGKDLQCLYFQVHICTIHSQCHNIYEHRKYGTFSPRLLRSRLCVMLMSVWVGFQTALVFSWVSSGCMRDHSQQEDINFTFLTVTHQMARLSWIIVGNDICLAEKCQPTRTNFLQ